jgi:hypothetical protein
MRMPRFRFSMRRMMVAVVTLALALAAIRWVAEMKTRSADSRRRARDFGAMSIHYGSGIITSDGGWVGMGEDENTRLIDRWACELSEKYWRLSDYPWLPVEPDPPPPERLARPRSGLDLPAETACSCWNRGSRPPAWAFLWTGSGRD